MKKLIFTLTFLNCSLTLANDSQKIINCHGGVSVYTSTSVADGIPVTIEFPLHGKTHQEQGTLQFRGENSWQAISPKADVTIYQSGDGFYTLGYHHQVFGSGCRMITPTI